MADQNQSGVSDAREVAATNRGMTPFTTTIAANGSVRVNTPGDYFHVFKAPVNDLMVAFDDGEPVPVQQGVGFRRYYKQFVLSSATGQTATVYMGYGTVQDGRATASVTTTVNIAPGANLNDGGDVSCPATSTTQLLAADVNRLYALIQNASANTVIVRIGTATVDATHGQPLEPGCTLPLATTAAIYAYNPSGGAVTINASAIKV